MRALPFLLLPTLALAQVTTNDEALKQLAPAAKPAAPQTVHRGRATHPAAHPARRAAIPNPPAVAAAPPPNPVIQPPPFVMPAHKPPPPPPVPVKDDAAGAATPLPAGGLRVTFGPGSADLNPATLAALRRIASDMQARPEMTVSVSAWAPGDAHDPSTPRRLSLDRALAARAVLINAGIVSDRILAIAHGANDIGAGPPDRLDLAEVLPPPSKAPPIAAPRPAGASAK